jgi:hypothetical protein
MADIKDITIGSVWQYAPDNNRKYKVIDIYPSGDHVPDAGKLVIIRLEGRLPVSTFRVSHTLTERMAQEELQPVRSLRI